MSAIPRIVLLVSASALLAACASSGDKEVAEEAEDARQPDVVVNALGVDCEAERDSGGFLGFLRGSSSEDGNGEQPADFRERARQSYQPSSRASREAGRDRHESRRDGDTKADDYLARYCEPEDGERRGFFGSIGAGFGSLWGAFRGDPDEPPRDFRDKMRDGQSPGVHRAHGVERGTADNDNAPENGQLPGHTEALAAALAAHGQGEATRDAAREPVAGGAPRTRVAVVADSPLRAELNNAFAAVAPDYPVRLLDDDTTRQALERAGCSLRDAHYCAETLRRTLGARVLVVLQGEDRERVTATYHDLELGGQPFTSRKALVQVDDRVPPRLLQGLADEVLMTGLERSRKASWFARPVERADDSRWLINAGAASGLESGQRLRVHGPGRIVRDNNGEPRAWVRGRARGTAEIVSLRDDDRAVVEVLNGQGLTPDDILIPES